jgi:hypothetical protein
MALSRKAFSTTYLAAIYMQRLKQLLAAFVNGCQAAAS